MNIAFEHSLAWLWLALPLATLWVAWLYFHRNRAEEWGARMRMALAGLRWIVIVVLVLLLLIPSIASILEEEEKPRLLIYSDVSASTSQGDRERSADLADRLTENLSERYEIRKLSFGAKPQFEDDSNAIDSLYTDLGSIVKSANEDFYGENIGALVVLSDGIQNRGVDPRYQTIQRGAPVFTVPLGDTSLQLDAEISEVLNNRLAFLNNDFEIKVRWSAVKLKGEQLRLRLIHEGETIAEQEVNVSTDRYAQEIRFVTDAKRLGMNKYTVVIDGASGDVNQLNDRAEAFVDVLDARTRVKILAKVPHPDVAFIKESVERNDQYEVDVDLLSDWDGRTDAYDLFITHGLPSSADDLNLIKRIATDGLPMLTVYTNDISPRHLNALNAGATLEAPIGKINQVGGSQDEAFGLFNISINEELKRYPPLIAPFGNVVFGTEHRVLLYQKIGSIETEHPLVSFTMREGQKFGQIYAEGLWKWHLFEASIGQQGWTREMVQKSVQYLAIKQKRTRLDVKAPRRVEEQEEIVFLASYYNQSYELNNDPEVLLSLTDSAGNQTDYRFRTTAEAYRLSIGSLLPGEYRWAASTADGQERFEETGTFTVAPNRAEFINSIADHGLLADWSRRTGGEMFSMDEQEALIARLSSSPSSKPVIHTSTDWSSIMDWRWLMFALVGLLGLEWFVRKYNGYV